nr:hypothetical protein [Tanacetum cinerariifolium]
VRQQARVVKYYNCQDPGIPDGQAAQTTIPNIAVFQTEDLDAYDSDCDDVFNAKVVLMANLSNYGSDVILEVSHFKPYHTDFGKRIVPQQELSNEQAFWLQTSHPNTDQSASSPIIIKAPKDSLSRILHKIMYQDVMICVMNSTAPFDDSVDVEMHSIEFYVKCLDLDVELLNKENAYNDLSKSYSQLEKHCISLELTMQLNQDIF